MIRIPKQWLAPATLRTSRGWLCGLAISMLAFAGGCSPPGTNSDTGGGMDGTDAADGNGGCQASGQCSCQFNGTSEGVCSEGVPEKSGDCTAPGNWERSETTCGDGEDNDCDGKTDCADPDCAGAGCGTGQGGAKCVSSNCVERRCNDGLDNDGDGKTDCYDPDCTGRTCNQTEGLKCPPPGSLSNPESTCDGIDDDCDGKTDEGIPVRCDKQKGVCNGAETSCRGETTSPVCEPEDFGDDYEVPEMSCDGKDNDCDGATDDWDSVTCEQYELVASENRDVVHDIARTPAGAVFAVGETNGEFPDTSGSDGDVDGFVAKYAPDGSRAWVDYIATADFDAAHGVAFYRGQVFVVGATLGSLGTAPSNARRDAFIAKYDAAGNGSSVDIQEFGTPARDVAYGVDVGGNGRIAVAGGTSGGLGIRFSNGKSDYFVAWYDTSLKQDRVVQGGGTSAEQAKAVHVRKGSQAYVVGEASGSFAAANYNGGLSDAFLARVERSGVQWVRMVGSSKRDAGLAVTTDGSGNVLAGGWTAGAFGGESSSGGRDGFVAAHDVSGSPGWVEMLGAGGRDAVESLHRADSGEILVGGRASGPIGGASHDGGADGLVAVYETSGTRKSIRLVGTGSFDAVHRLVDAGSNRLIAAGETADGIGGNSYEGGKRDGFLGLLSR